MSGNIDLRLESGENQMSFGGLGIRVLTGASVAGEHFAVLHAKVDSIISCTSNLSEGDSSLTDYFMPAGWYIVGDFSNVNVSEGGEVNGYLKQVV